MVGTLSGRLAVTAGAVLAARILGPEGFGELGMVQSTVLMLAMLVEFGFGLTATKHVAELRREDPDRAGRVAGLVNLAALVWGLVGAVLLVTSAPSLAAGVLAAPQLEGALRLSAIILIPAVLEGAQRDCLMGLEAFRWAAVTSLVSGAASLPLLVGGAWLAGLTGAVLGLALTRALGLAATGLALNAAATHTGVKPTYRACLGEWRLLASFGLPALLTVGVGGAATWSCNAILVNTPYGYAEMARLTASLQWRGLLLFVPGIILRVALPIMSSAQPSAGRVPDARGAVADTFAATVVTVFPLGCLVMFCSGWILRLYGADYADSAVVLVGLVSSVMLTSAGAFAGPSLQARGKVWAAFCFNLGWAAVLLALTAWLAPSLGAAAVALGHVAAYLLLTLTQAWYLRADLPPGIWGRMLGALTWALVATGVCLGVSPTLRVLLAAPMALVTLLGSLLLLPLGDPALRPRADRPNLGS